MVISISHLSKYYQIHKKEPGFTGTFRSFFARKYETVKAVDDISFDIQQGELVGFIGPNGAGKTTTLKCLSGLLYPDNGSISVLGFTPFERKTNFLKQISLVMGQKNQLWWDLPVMDTLLLQKEIYELSGMRFEKLVNELSELLDVKNQLYVAAKKLSLGQRMKCELIAALIHSPKVLFLDEPTIGLDVIMQQKLRNFIKEYNKTYRATILLTSHYMRDVEELCERIIIIDHGKIMYDGSLSDIVKKFATHKIISVTFEGPVEEKELTFLGNVQAFAFPKTILSVKRKDSNKIAAKLLEHFPVGDLIIEESPIEDIVRDIFSKGVQ